MQEMLDAEANARRFKNQQAFKRDFESQKLKHGFWYLYADGKQILEAPTEREMNRAGKPSLRLNPMGFHAIHDHEKPKSTAGFCYSL